jgi:hypothetical protein
MEKRWHYDASHYMGFSTLFLRHYCWVFQFIFSPLERKPEKYLNVNLWYYFKETIWSKSKPYNIADVSFMLWRSLNLTAPDNLEIYSSWRIWLRTLLVGARGSVVGWDTMLEAGGSRVRFPMRSLDFFQFTWSFQLHYGHGVDSASNRNEYQESSWGKG